jgi:hypothetical protein
MVIANQGVELHIAVPGSIYGLFHNSIYLMPQNYTHLRYPARKPASPNTSRELRLLKIFVEQERNQGNITHKPSQKSPAPEQGEA